MALLNITAELTIISPKKAKKNHSDWTIPEIDIEALRRVARACAAGLAVAF